MDTWSKQYTSNANLLLFVGWLINDIIYSSIPYVAGTLNDKYKLFAILSVLFVITYILNYDNGAYVTFFINLSTTFADVVWSKSLTKCNVYVYYGFYSFSYAILSILGYIKF